MNKPSIDRMIEIIEKTPAKKMSRKHWYNYLTNKMCPLSTILVEEGIVHTENGFDDALGGRLRRTAYDTWGYCFTDHMIALWDKAKTYGEGKKAVLNFLRSQK